MTQAPATCRHDYAPPPWRCLAIELEFDLDAAATEVTARLQLEPDPGQPLQPLRLDGEALELLELRVDGDPVAADGMRIDPAGLTLPGIDRACTVQTRVRIGPERNTRLEGLYASEGLLLTQCEAHGFRRITYALDRPDVLSRYEVLLRADAARYPVLLGNGNCEDAGRLPDGRHYARWVDPEPKPCYLFALVAGALDSVRARHTTHSGNDVAVAVWAAPEDVTRCRHALQCVLRAMRWDEQRFGREYDMAEFNVVAARDFNMGAMENTGLNIFNARYILADPDSATDADFSDVESVIGHEYFHHWSGNRVTVRDWFQLALKEGLTVFRDQEFTSDMNSRAVKRIEDVRMLRARQFVEDSGPLAHAVRPDSYREIDNFYTATVYEKGAEIVRMLHTLLGETAFRQGLDLYFARHRGSAVTIEAFVAAMTEAGQRDLSGFLRWYSQAGTPVVEIRDSYDATTRRYEVQITQHTPPTPGQSEKQPLPIPLAYALYDARGRRIERALAGDAPVHEGLIELSGARHTLCLEDVEAAPLPAFGQALSAPVRVRYDYGPDALGRLASIERDPLLRWDAIQRLATDAILARGEAGASRLALLDATAVLLEDAELDPAFVAQCLQLPAFDTLADEVVASAGTVDVDRVWAAREELLDELAERHVERLERRYQDMAAVDPGAMNAPAIAARRLKNTALDLLTRMDPAAALAQTQFAAAATMTDRLAALRALVHADASAAPQALSAFASRHGADALVTDKWLAIVASAPLADALGRVQGLMTGRHWLPRNPNRVRAILGSFARGNPVAFHRADGAGYALLLGAVAALDAANPQLAARQLGALENWQHLDAARAQHIRAGLQSLRSAEPSSLTTELLDRLLAG